LKLRHGAAGEGQAGILNLFAPFGFFGAGNIGDESTLQGFARLLDSYGNGFRVWVASRNPAHTNKVEPKFNYFKFRGRDPRRRWARFRAQAQVIIGGTPIMDVLGKWPLSELTPLIDAARQEEEPVVFIGSGIEDLKSEESRHLVARTIAPAVRHWTVRCERDKQRLIDYGIRADRVTVAADLAWALDPVSDDFGKNLLKQFRLSPDDYLVGVNLTNESFLTESQPELFPKIAEFLDALIAKRQARVLFVANEVREEESFDKAAALKTLGLMKNRNRACIIPNEYRTPQQMLSLVSCCNFTVSMRYHFCLFSALQAVPFIALKRSDKVDDFCWDLDWPYATSLTTLDPQVLMEMALEIEKRRTGIVDILHRQVWWMRMRSVRNRAALSALLS
jgi:polysaccharide pyruvyl transferase WcaK-like protein